MTIETIIDHGQPDFEPGNPPPGAQPDAGLHAEATAAVVGALAPLSGSVSKRLLGVLK